MAEETAPLIRIVTLLDRARNAQNTGHMAPNMLALWPMLVGMVQPTVQAPIPASLRLWATLAEEYERGVHQFTQTALQEQDYRASVEAGRQLFSIAAMHQQPQSFILQVLPDPTMGVLRIGSRLVPKTERLLKEGELKDLDNAIADLAIATNGLPENDVLRHVLERELSLIRQARWEYPIVGGVALRDALFSVEGTIINVTDDGGARTEPERAALTSAFRLSRAIRAAIATAGLAKALGEAFESAPKIGEGMAKAVLYLEGVTTTTPEDSPPSEVAQ